MKVITLKQPWASLVAYGYKKYEFRSWKLNYRGPILIHAGLGIDKEAMQKVKDLKLEFPSKKIIGIVSIDDCILLDETISSIISKENHLVYGNKIRTGYAWKLSNAKLVNIPESVSGKQGIWNYSFED
mgnify:CR=1 FL=1